MFTNLVCARTMAGRLERAGMEELQESDAARNLRVGGGEKGVLQTGLQSTLNSPTACWKQAVWFLKVFGCALFTLPCGQGPRFRVTKGAGSSRLRPACGRRSVGVIVSRKRACRARLNPPRSRKNLRGNRQLSNSLVTCSQARCAQNEPPPLREAISVHEWF